MFNYLIHSRFLILGFLFLVGASGAKAQDIEKFYDDVDAFLSTHVADGLVDYGAIKSTPARLNQLLDQIAGFDRSSLDAATEKSFLINAYNILVIKNVVDHYPMDSPLEANGFFDRDAFQVAGETKTLDGLEKRDLYVKYPDARLHFVLVCAALGCPELIESAYRAATLEAQLDAQTRAALNNPVHVRPATSGNEVQISELFSWYTDDFTRDGQSVIEYINTYRTDALPADANLGYITYNWQLNDVKKKP